MKRPAVFLDRDGVINYNCTDYVKSWQEFRFLPGVLPALRRLATLGLPTVVISNQSAIARGLVSSETVDEINARMVESVAAAGGRLDLVLYCPHSPDEGCDCRKPQPGLLLRAAALLELDLTSSFFIGDATSDVLAARAAGCRSLLVRTGFGDRALKTLLDCRICDFDVADDLDDAISRVISTANLAELVTR